MHLEQNKNYVKHPSPAVIARTALAGPGRRRNGGVAGLRPTRQRPRDQCFSDFRMDDRQHRIAIAENRP